VSTPPPQPPQPTTNHYENFSQALEICQHLQILKNHDNPSSSFKKVILQNNQKGNHPFLPKHFASLDIKKFNFQLKH